MQIAFNVELRDTEWTKGSWLRSRRWGSVLRAFLQEPEQAGSGFDADAGDLAAFFEPSCKSEKEQEQETPSMCSSSVQPLQLQEPSSEFRAIAERSLSQTRTSPSEQSSPAATSPSPAKRPKLALTAAAEAQLRLQDFLQDSDDSDSDSSDSLRDKERLLRRYSQEEQELSQDSDSEDSDSDSRPPSKQALTAEAQVRERRLFSDSDDSDADESDSPLDTDIRIKDCIFGSPFCMLKLKDLCSQHKRMMWDRM
ncbi:uncharacterized protein LOC134777167 [Penaeus indicus]|uniref:uncharacterized protein LOC134777167 n=1 Tax=Penaeus indicus TaxID=29960 RepID=UPI00300CD331